MAKRNAVQSPVMQFMTLAWDHRTAGVAFSWERINHTMWKTLTVALGALEFTLDDYRDVAKSFRSGYWLRTEDAYGTAVANGNMSACLSIEKYLGREPLIADNVEMGSRWSRGDANAHLIGDRQKERLHVGCSLMWKGEKVTVTSFTGDAAIACSYKPRSDGSVTDKEFAEWLATKGWTSRKPLPSGVARELRTLCCERRRDYSNKVLHRYTITRDAIIADRAERKRRQEIWDRLGDVLEKDPDGPVNALAAIGVKTAADFDKAPLKKLEKVLAKFQPKGENDG